MSKAEENAVTSYAENRENITSLEDEQPKPVVDKQKDVEEELQEFDNSKNNRTLFKTSRQLIYLQLLVLAIDGDHLQNSDCIMSGHV